MILANYPNAKVVYGDSVIASTPVITEFGSIPITKLRSGKWRTYKHIDAAQEALGRLYGKKVAPASGRVRTHNGYANAQYLVKHWYEGTLYKISFTNGTSITVTGDHCIWHDGRWVSAKNISPGFAFAQL